MSNFIVRALGTNDYNTNGLTRYEKNGLELFIHKDGSVYASQSAMARMVKHDNDTKVRHFLDRHFKHVTPLKTHTNKGGKQSSLWGVEVIVALADEFYPELSKKFKEAGAKMYLYQLAGYKITVAPLQVIDPTLSAIAAMESYISVLKNTMLKPGIKVELDQAIENNGNLLPGEKMTVPEMAEKSGKGLDARMHRELGKGMIAKYRQTYHEDNTDKKRHRYRDKSGNYQSYLLPVYPADMYVNFLSLCAAYGY